VKYLLTFKLLFLVISLLGPRLVFSEEKVDLFIIKMFSGRVVVLSPRKMGSSLRLIIENRTLSKLIGKITNQDEKILSSVAIDPNKAKAVNLSINKGDQFFFIPLSPAFQEVPLKIGSKPYEIPPKK
jgi:hypothetical protein